MCAWVRMTTQLDVGAPDKPAVRLLAATSSKGADSECAVLGATPPRNRSFFNPRANTRYLPLFATHYAHREKHLRMRRIVAFLGTMNAGPG